MPFASNFGFFKDAVDGDVRFRDSLTLLMKTDNTGASNNDQVKLPMRGGPYLIDWGDGTIETQSQTSTTPSSGGGITHTYSTAGQYTIKIKDTASIPTYDASDPTTWQMFQFYGLATQDPQKLLKVLRWGTPGFQFTDRMFLGCTNLSILSTVDTPPTTATTYTNFFRMFEDCTSLTNGGTISTWDTSNVLSISQMFKGANQFNESLNGWTSFSATLTDMSQVFMNATAFNGNISSWDTSTITKFDEMFSGATAFTSNIGSWNISAGTSFRLMFFNATSFNYDIGSWTFKSGAGVGDAFGMFEGASAFNQNIGSWYTGQLQYNMTNMFKDATIFNQDLTGWCVDILSSEPSNFSQNSALTSANLPVWGTCP